MPGVLYRNLNVVMLPIKTSSDFYLFYDFPYGYGRILTLFMQVLGTLDIMRNTKTNKTFQEIYKDIVVQ